MSDRLAAIRKEQAMRNKNTVRLAGDHVWDSDANPVDGDLMVEATYENERPAMMVYAAENVYPLPANDLRFTVPLDTLQVVLEHYGYTVEAPNDE